MPCFPKYGRILIENEVIKIYNKNSFQTGITKSDLQKDLFHIKKLDIYIMQIEGVHKLYKFMMHHSNYKLLHIIRKMKIQKETKINKAFTYLEDMGIMIVCEEEEALSLYKKSGFTDRELAVIKEWWCKQNKGWGEVADLYDTYFSFSKEKEKKKELTLPNFSNMYHHRFIHKN